MENKEELDDGKSSVDVRRLSAPIVTMISVLSFVVWGTYTLLNEKTKIYDNVMAKIEDIRLSHSSELKQFYELQHLTFRDMVTLKDRQNYMLKNIWTKKDQQIWCFETQKKNRNFICPEYDFRNDNTFDSSEKYGIQNNSVIRLNKLEETPSDKVVTDNN